MIVAKQMNEHEFVAMPVGIDHGPIFFESFLK
jgi:hypothetical protein